MFASMLGGIGIKLAILAVILSAVAGVYIYIQVLRSDLAEAQQAVGALQTAHAVQTETIDALEAQNHSWKLSFEAFQVTLSTMAENQKTANEHSRKLNDVLSRHDLTALSLAKPGLIERRINSGTAGILSLFESESDRSKDRTGSD